MHYKSTFVISSLAVLHTDFCVKMQLIVRTEEGGMIHPKNWVNALLPV